MGSERTLSVDIAVSTPQFTLEVSLEAPPGITILFGPSGSGKSTTLSAIAGLTQASAGKIALGGDVWFDSAAKIDRPVHLRGLAFVFQSVALFPHMSGVENVAYGIERSVARSDRYRLAMAMLERMRVADLARRRPSTFSGGEAQRVALARAFARSPSLVLLDEPFSAMDRELRGDLCADVKATVRDLNLPAIMVTHDRDEARAVGDRVVILRSGRVAAAGTIHTHLPDVDRAPSPPQA